MLAFLWVIWLRLVKRNMLENTNIQVPKCYSLKLFRTSHTNVCFWKIPSDILESLKSECKPLLVQLQSEMHYLEKIKHYQALSLKCHREQIFQGIWDYAEIQEYWWALPLTCQNVLGSASSSSPPTPFPATPPNLEFLPVLSECPCYKELFRNT